MIFYCCIYNGCELDPYILQKCYLGELQSECFGWVNPRWRLSLGVKGQVRAFWSPLYISCFLAHFCDANLEYAAQQQRQYLSMCAWKLVTTLLAVVTWWNNVCHVSCPLHNFDVPWWILIFGTTFHNNQTVQSETFSLEPCFVKVILRIHIGIISSNCRVRSISSKCLYQFWYLIHMFTITRQCRENI